MYCVFSLKICHIITNIFLPIATKAFLRDFRIASFVNLSIKKLPLVREAAQATCTIIVLRCLLPLVVAVLLNFPALSSFLGRTPALSYKAEAKGKDRQEVEFFAKFVLCSNNETCPIIVEKGETRYWVQKIHPLTQMNVNMLDSLKREIPQFLHLLLKRELSTRKEFRMWFRHDLLITDALRRIITHNRGKVENEMIHIISDLIQIQGIEEYQFSVNELFDMVR